MSIYGDYAFKTLEEESSTVKGLDFPVSESNTGGLFSKSYDLLNIRAGLIQLILTRRGERVMLPDFGTDIRETIFEPLDGTTVTELKTQISTAIDKYAPEVIINLLEITPDNATQTISIKLVFSTKNNISKNYTMGLLVSEKGASIT